MAENIVTRNLLGMDELDFRGWNNADWNGVFAHYHTDDVVVEMKGMATTHGIGEHIDAMKDSVTSTGGTPVQVTSHPIRFGSGCRHASALPSRCLRGDARRARARAELGE